MSEYTGPEMVVGKLRGYRNWMLMTPSAASDEGWDDGLEMLVAETNTDRTGPILKALAWNYFWSGRSIKAKCFAGGGSPRHCQCTTPTATCECGIYSHSQPPNSFGEFGPFRRLLGPKAFIGGVISNTGRVFVGSKGFRSERSTIEALLIHPDTAGWFMKHVGRVIDDIYGDIPIYTSEKELVKDYPPHDISLLLG